MTTSNEEFQKWKNTPRTEKAVPCTAVFELYDGTSHVREFKGTDAWGQGDCGFEVTHGAHELDAELTRQAIRVGDSLWVNVKEIRSVTLL